MQLLAGHPLLLSSSRPVPCRRSQPCRAHAAVQEAPAPARISGLWKPSPPQQPAEPPSVGSLGWPQGFSSCYTLGRRIGTGSYGSCFLAHDAVGRSCCVKVIPKTRGKQKIEKVLRKIGQEADFLLRAQESLGVVQLHAKFEDAAYAYLCTELCSGGDLERLVEEEGPLPEAAVARLLLEILQVVDACHRAGFVHGDVKPANFVLKLQHGNPVWALQSGSGLQGSWLKAIDFGCSQVVGTEALSRRTGTPVFMAPEIFDRSYSLPADLWSCGMLCYQLLCGRFPFWSTLADCQKASLEEVIEAVTTTPIDLQHAPWLHVSPSGLDLLAGLLQRDPAQRLTASQALQHPWFVEQLGEAWTAPRSAREAPAEPAAAAEPSSSPATHAVWQAAQQVALRLFT